MKNLAEFQKEYRETLEQIKQQYKVDRVINSDQKAIYSQVPRHFEHQNGLIWGDSESKVLVIDFKFYHDFRGDKHQYLTGYNKCSSPEAHDKGEFYDSCLNLILPLDSEQNERLKANFEAKQQSKKDWLAFKEIELNNKKLGERFEIGETIFWHFLEVLPPIYGKGCFYCSEPVKHTTEGELVYYKITETNKKYFIELNTIQK